MKNMACHTADQNPLDCRATFIPNDNEGAAVRSANPTIVDAAEGIRRRAHLRCGNDDETLCIWHRAVTLVMDPFGIVDNVFWEISRTWQHFQNRYS